MTEVRLTNVKWIDPGIAAALEQAGVTVQDLAKMDGDDLLAQYPFVGTINAWLLVEEARHVMEQIEAGLWDPAAKLDLEFTLSEIEEQERLDTLTRIRPLMDWPPTPVPLEQLTGKSVRIQRIEQMNLEEQARQAERDRLQEQLLEAEQEDDETEGEL